MLHTLSQQDLARAFPRAARADTGFSRRRFLTVASLGGLGFVIGCGEWAGADLPATPAAGGTFNAFVRIGADDTVTVVIKHLDKGQGVTTGLPTIVAEELDADWAQMRWEFAPADASRYNNLFFGAVQGTGGSTSIANSWQQLRQAGAAARAMLVEAAAREWGVPAAEITVTKGLLRHASGKSASFGALAASAAAIAPPADPKLKQAGEFTLIGAALPRIDSPEKTTGKALYTIDFTRPGMLTAVIAHPPKFGATVAKLDATAAMQTRGVVEVVQIPRGVAVLADGYWAALQGRNALKIEWDESAAERRGTEALFTEYRRLAGTPGAVAKNEGDSAAALAQASKVIEAEFEFPYLAHATMEPLNAVVELREKDCEVWTAAQLPSVDQQVLAQITGFEPAQIRINTLIAGGSFGRRAVPDSDYIAEAAMIAKAIKGRAPVKLQWSREDDLRAGRYRPMALHRLQGGLDEAGNIVAWRQRIVVQSFLKGTPFEASIKDGIDDSAVEGARDLPYKIPNLHVDLHLAEIGVPTLWWRSVGHTHTGFATEVFFDQLAAAAGKDPIEERRRLLADQPRHLGVLNLAIEKAGAAPAGRGRGRGVAVHASFNSFVAQIADVTVADDGSFKVDRVVCAVDCGIAINPDIVRAQMEGGIGFGLGAVLREEISLQDGAVVQSNFHDYRPLRIGDMPAIDVHIVPSAEPPTGVGEPGVPPIGPAVANALRAVTGKPIHKLPIGERVAI